MQDPYPATFQRRHHNISLGAVFFCLHVNNNLPIIGKFTNKKHKDIIKIGSAVNSRSVVCVLPRYNTLTTIRCIYSSLEISAGEDQFQLLAWDTNTQNDSTSTNLEGYYIVMPMLSK